MNVVDFVWISIGETLLGATFVLGILVGMTLAKKEPRNGDSN
jgi:hypothetical protein